MAAHYNEVEVAEKAKKAAEDISLTDSGSFACKESVIKHDIV